MQHSPNNATLHGDNVEVLGFTPVPPRQTAQQVDGAAQLDLSNNGPLLMVLDERLAGFQTDMQGVVARTAEVAVHRALASSHASVLGTFRAIGVILATRLILLLALIGAFALAWAAMANPTWPSIAILISYVLLTVLPLVWLERNGRRSHNE